MWRVRQELPHIRYWKKVEGGWRESIHPAGIANELIRRSDSYKVDGGELEIDGGVRYPICDLERLVA